MWHPWKEPLKLCEFSMQWIMSVVAARTSGKQELTDTDGRPDQTLTPPPPLGSASKARVQRTFATMMDVASRGDDESFAAYLSHLGVRTADDVSRSKVAMSMHTEVSPSRSQTDVLLAPTAEERHCSPCVSSQSSVSRTASWLSFSPSLHNEAKREAPIMGDAPESASQTEKSIISSPNLKKDAQREAPSFGDAPAELVSTAEPQPRTPLRSSLRSTLSLKHVAPCEAEYDEQDFCIPPAPPPSPMCLHPSSTLPNAPPPDDSEQSDARSVMRAWASAPTLRRKVCFSATQEVLIIPARPSSTRSLGLSAVLDSFLAIPDFLPK